jgi:hypothetical protein
MSGKQMNKWIEQEQAAYHLLGNDQALLIQCALGNFSLLVGEILRLPGGFVAKCLPVNHPSSGIKYGKFNEQAQAISWVVTTSEAILEKQRSLTYELKRE